MSHIGYLLIDGMNIAHASNAGPVLKAGEQQTQAIFGGLRTIRKTICLFPMLKPVVLWDGPEMWRAKFFPEYKGKRDAPPTTKHEIERAAQRAALKTQLPHLKRGLRLAGVPQIVCQNLEADDLAGILSRRYADQGKKVMLISADKDWLQLLRPNVGWIDPINDLRVSMATFTDKIGYEKVTKTKVKNDDGTPLLDPITSKQAIEETTEWRGCPTPRAFLEVKALMGDSSDEIPGVGGVGEVGAFELVRQYGSVQRFFEQVEIEKIPLPKKLADFCASPEKKEIFYRNMHLMDLNHQDVPKPNSMVVTTKPADAAAFTEFAGEFAFASILKDVDGWLAPLSQN